MRYKCPVCDDFETDVEEYYHFHLTQSEEDGGCDAVCPCGYCQEEI